jgi:hypothetical protein
VFIFDLCPSIVVCTCHHLRDSLLDVSGDRSVFVVDFAHGQELVESFFIGFTDGLGSLGKVVLLIVLAGVVLAVCFFVHHDFVFSLVEQAFSHVLILLQSGQFFDILLDDHNEVFIGCINSVLIISRCGLFGKLAFELEHFVDVFLSNLLDVLVNLRLSLGLVSEVVSMGVQSSAHLLNETNNGSGGSNAAKEFENKSSCHIFLELF